MICNLNPLSFKGFGTVSPERTADALLANLPKVRELVVGRIQAPVYRAEAEIWLQSRGGMVALSVSKDGTNFQHYYLDKLVCINPGIYYCLSPFQQDSASVQLFTDTPICETGEFRQVDNYHLPQELWVNGLYTFFYHEKELGFVFPGEAHSVLELTYVDQGSLHSVADGTDLLLEQGDMVIYAPNQWHMQYADIDVAPRYVTISFDLGGGDLTPLYGRKLHPSQSTISLLQAMLKEQERMDPYSADLIISQLTQLLLRLLRQSDDSPQKLKASNSLHAENEIIRRAQQYISNHIREKLSVPLVARMVDVSPSYMTALFQKNLQISPGEYIRRIKLQESKQMIRENSMNFTEIATALQYSTVHHFSRQFKDKFGITPSEYAKSVR
ncbi:MAG: helix-turn-helix transcriptional regulator [Oscillospiraceae bacterium]|nr:helix-turn-helix transcriptional regulator [Oscillospiraceae bacterium]